MIVDMVVREMRWPGGVCRGDCRPFACFLSRAR